MAHLAARPHLRLVVEVQVGARHGQAPRDVGLRRPGARAEQVDHRRRRRPHADLAQRQVEHAAQVVLELRGLAGLDRVVARVVGARRELVDQHLAAGQQEHLHAGHAEAVGAAAAAARATSAAAPAASGGDRRRRHDLVADVVAPGRSRPPGRRASAPPGERATMTASSRSKATRPSASTPSPRVEAGERLARLLLVGAGRVAVAVVAQPAGLEHQRPAEVAAGGGEVRRAARPRGRGPSAGPRRAAAPSGAPCPAPSPSAPASGRTGVPAACTDASAPASTNSFSSVTTPQAAPERAAPRRRRASRPRRAPRPSGRRARRAGRAPRPGCPAARPPGRSSAPAGRRPAMPTS